MIPFDDVIRAPQLVDLHSSGMVRRVLNPSHESAKYSDESSMIAVAYAVRAANFTEKATGPWPWEVCSARARASGSPAPSVGPTPQVDCTRSTGHPSAGRGRTRVGPSRRGALLAPVPPCPRSAFAARLAVLVRCPAP